MAAVSDVCSAALRRDIWGSAGRDGLLGMSGPVSSQPGTERHNPGMAQLEAATKTP